MCLMQDPCIVHAILQLEMIKAFCRVCRGPLAWLSLMHNIIACKQRLMQPDAQIGCYAFSLYQTLSPFYHSKFMTSIKLTNHLSLLFCGAHSESTLMIVLRSAIKQ